MAPIRRLMLLLLTSLLLPAGAAVCRAEQAYLFVNPKDDSSRVAAAQIQTLLLTSCEDGFFEYVDQNLIVGETLADYIQRTGKREYIHARVQEFHNGLLLEFLLKTPQQEKEKTRVLNTAMAANVSTIRAELEEITTTFKAMQAGYSTDQLIYIDCFCPGSGNAPLLERFSRTITLGLVISLKDTDLANTYWLHGIVDNDCAGNCSPDNQPEASKHSRRNGVLQRESQSHDGDQEKLYPTRSGYVLHPGT